MNDLSEISISAATYSAVMEEQVEKSSRSGGEADSAAIDAGNGCAPTLASEKLLATIKPTTQIALTGAPASSPTNTFTTFIPLTSFKYFPKLPYELRRMIFIIAIEDSLPRILAIQPQYRDHPSLIQINHEARDACAKYYHYCASKQRTKLFRFFIDYQKDILYLNHPFTLLGGKCQLSPLQATHSIYPEFLELIETLAMNLKEVRNLSGNHRGKNTIWNMLNRWCPKLKELKIVVNNFPMNGLFLDFLPIKTAKQYAQMIPKNKQEVVEEVSMGFKKARKEGGILMELKMRLVVVDENARKVKTKKERALIAEARKKANAKVDGVAEVDGLVVQNGAGAGSAGKGFSNAAKKHKVFKKTKPPCKKKGSDAKLRLAKAIKAGKKASGKGN
ncbi:hypothetical protein BKA65DRAFT_552321 [Rhexocercosporidium sp. MPI-PUGE-AT-0058]|nr:hypothetical protein BKA65DRAFT_552321 [Rhexocercosporidium sp. MPI-PUGE-AT-0058]